MHVRTFGVAALSASLVLGSLAMLGVDDAASAATTTSITYAYDFP